MMNVFRFYLSLSIAFVFTNTIQAQQIVHERGGANDFAIAANKAAASLLVDAADDSLVMLTAELFAEDVRKVTAVKPAVVTSSTNAENLVIVGTLEHSKYIKQLLASGKIKADSIQGKWDAYQIVVVQNPFKGVKKALVIAGSNKRGAAYGVLEISKQMGVSPWYYMADVPVKTKPAVFIDGNVHLVDAPKVKYRGIFINDEAPALSGWAKEKFGTFNSKFYVNVFELILRCKGNYLWPAMWGNAFNDDDKMNPVLADKWGIVMGTSHHEPMVRSQQEWKRFGKGAWDYEKNDTVLRDFWKEGIENMGKKESIVTVGMRGDGDMPMSRQTATDLLERIVADQRKIIAEVTGKPASETPQLWALYKEVQDYYDQGMRVPDDVTLLLCDDNWGNIRKLPRLTDKPRTGGYGIYYHFDYVGGPRNYKWLNTNNLSRVWEQMHLAYSFGVDEIWIVNVGDIKPMELPISFFLDYAWDPDEWTEDNILSYYTNWAADQFNADYASKIGDVLRRYAQYSHAKTPELLNDRTYSLTNYHEFDRVLDEWNQLEKDALATGKKLSAAEQDAYFQLVSHPVEAMANLYRMYYAVAMNKYLASRSNPKANVYAKQVEDFYKMDSLITLKYHTMNNGKWNHMMSQNHIGYTYWQEPRVQVMPATVAVDPNAKPAQDSTGLRLDQGVAFVPPGDTNRVFYEKEGVVSMEAAHWTALHNTNNINWKVVPEIGKRESGVTSFPVTDSAILSANSPYIQYDFYSYDSGAVKLQLHFAPTLNFHNNEGLKFAVSVDEGAPVTVVLNSNELERRQANSWVGDQVIIRSVDQSLASPGKHNVRYWMISPAVVLRKLVVDFGGLKPSYLGPPETMR